MLYNIITNVGNVKKPWSDVPVEVLIEEERKKEESRKDHREQLHAPPPTPTSPRYDNLQFEDDEDYKIVIRF